MADKWTFMKAVEVYAYPSANAEDGGDVNSEANVSGITRHLTQKNFIVDDRSDRSVGPMPLEVSKGTNSKGQSTVNVYKGSVILDGYYIKLKPEGGLYIIQGQTIDSTYINNISAFSQRFNRIFNSYYMYENNKESSGHIVPKPHKKGEGADLPENKLPTIHLVLKLVKNNTSNLRGDLFERKSSGAVDLMCRACAWTFIIDEDLARLNVPYVDIAEIIIKPGTSSTPVTIYEVVNPPTRSSYIYIDSIYDDEGRPLSETIKEEIEKGTGDLPKITHYVYDDPSDLESPRYKDLEISVEDGEPKIVKYTKKSPESYEDNGDYKAVVSSGINDTYSIGDIQKRTHVASSDTTPHYLNDARPSLTDNRDNNAGQITSSGTITGSTDTKNDNGHSALLARADHTHDKRYLVKSSGSTSADADAKQVVGTNVQFTRNVETSTFKDGALEVDVNGDFDNGVVETVIANKNNTATTTRDSCAVKITGSTNVAGYLSADKVYNAVWNDYAELYKKEFIDEDYEEGTVICKTVGRNTYSASDYSRKRLVVGVVTNSYGHLLGGDKDKSLEENLKEYIPISLSGRVPVKVEQHKLINEGDLLTVSSYKGLATSSDYPEQGTVIGKALESSDGTKDKILMQVMLG